MRSLKTSTADGAAMDALKFDACQWIRLGSLIRFSTRTRNCAPDWVLMPQLPSGCDILNTEAGLPFTSMLRRSSRSTVGSAPLVSAPARGTIREPANVVATELATADNNARRDSIKPRANAKRSIASHPTICPCRGEV
jgi:hypothetical protein